MEATLDRHSHFAVRTLSTPDQIYEHIFMGLQSFDDHPLPFNGKWNKMNSTDITEEVDKLMETIYTNCPPSMHPVDFFNVVLIEAISQDIGPSAVPAWVDMRLCPIPRPIPELFFRFNVVRAMHWLLNWNWICGVDQQKKE